MAKAVYRKIMLAGEDVRVRCLKHSRAKRMRITVRQGGEVLLTVPRYASLQSALSFLFANAGWVTRERQKQLAKGDAPEISAERYALLKKRTRALVEEKIAKLNAHYGFSWKKISVRNQKTRWGSCSRQGNLSFNCRLALLPEQLAEYIIVHELCHLGEFNHGACFWQLVGRAVPEYPKLKKQLAALSLQ